MNITSCENARKMEPLVKAANSQDEEPMQSKTIRGIDLNDPNRDILKNQRKQLTLGRSSRVIIHSPNLDLPTRFSIKAKAAFL